MGFRVRDTKHSTTRILALALITFLLLAGCDLAAIGSTDDDVVAHIVEPANGAQLPAVDTIIIKTRIANPAGASKVVLMVNGVLERDDQLSVPLQSGNMLQAWRPPGPGLYSLQVIVVGAHGDLTESNTVVILIGGEDRAEVSTSTPTQTPLPTSTPTLTVAPSGTPTQTLVPSLTPTITMAPIPAPNPVGPTGSLSCRSTVFLEWSPVSHPNGIVRYEWNLEGDGSHEAGSTTGASFEVIINCGTTYRWRVRAVDSYGNYGPYSSFVEFEIE